MRAIADLAARIAEIERRMSGAMVPGTVAQVDPAKGLVRLKIGKDSDGGDLLSPWVPYAQTAGALKVHSPPSVGQQMAISSPSGDLENGLAQPWSFSASEASPSSSGDTHKLTFGNVAITLTAGGLQITCGGVAVNITGSGVAISGGTVTHNGKNIGSTHVHGGVMGGPNDTDSPK